MRVPRSGSRNHPDHVLQIPEATLHPARNPAGSVRKVGDTAELQPGEVCFVHKASGQLYAARVGEALRNLKRGRMREFEQVHTSTKGSNP